MLRLDPALPLLWRTPEEVQLGVDPALAVLRVEPGEERLLAALEAGVSGSGYRMLAQAAGVGPDRAEALLAGVAPALARAAAPRARIAVLGSGAVAREIASQLADRGEFVAASARQGARGGAPGAAASGTSGPARLDAVVLVAAGVIAPEDHARWLRRDVAHLPVVVRERAAEVGPWVQPGRGPCLYCVHLARAEADPSWPALAIQLWGRPHPALERRAVAEIAAFAGRRLDAALGEALRPDDDHDDAEAVSWRIDLLDGTVSERRWRRHPDCLCSAPSGSDWGLAAAPAAPPAPRRATAVAVPA